MLGELLRLEFARRRPEWGALPLRLFISGVLIWGTQDNILSSARMLEFRDFLAQHGFPAPLVSAYLSAYAQFVCGVLILMGAFTRYAALVMILNFAAALAMVHLGLPFEQNIAPLAMLFGSVFLLFHGPGIYSVDAALERRSARVESGVHVPARPGA